MIATIIIWLHNVDGGRWTEGDRVERPTNTAGTVESVLHHDPTPRSCIVGLDHDGSPTSSPGEISIDGRLR